ncbi:unnamed protein product, partial [Brenthis ino]
MPQNLIKLIEIAYTFNAKANIFHFLATCNNIGFHGETVQSDTSASGIVNYDFTNSPIIDGEEITVSILDNKLIVSALYEEKSDTSTTYRKCHQEFHFPKEVNPETIASSLSNDVLVV